jgi:hypothetical protein
MQLDRTEDVEKERVFEVRHDHADRARAAAGK